MSGILDALVGVVFVVVLEVIVVGRGLVHHLDVARLAMCSVQLIQLSLGQVVHDTRAIRVSHHIHRGTEPVPGIGNRNGWEYTSVVWR